ncbi:MAG TPA: AmmeMemoRadiSam system protein A [Ignavibacteriaceae bacterium]|nr:AmmeMemoRadiSam system protein A [Ignavibacteriaceae bacterium]
MEISAEEKKILLEAARLSIQSVFGETSSPSVEYSLYPCLKANAGAFVTLTINEKLRGCIGYIYSQGNLFETVCNAARQAAFSDPRFRPLSSQELPHVKIEISVLSPPVPISSYDEIKLGIHGLILEDKEHRALLLPQVAAKNNLNLNQFLAALCEKAGLIPGYYMVKKLNLKVFTASIFSESEMEHAD